MEFIDKRRLLKLLSITPKLSFADDLNDMEGYLVSPSVPGREIAEIYIRRFETAGNKFDGFTELIKILPTLVQTKKKIHSFDLNSKHILIFTDPKTKIIYGSLVERQGKQNGNQQK